MRGEWKNRPSLDLFDARFIGVEEFENESTVSPVHLSNANPLIESIDAGIVRSASDVQLLNKPFSMVGRFSDRRIVFNKEQSANAYSPIEVTASCIVSDGNDEQLWNEFCPILVSVLASSTSVSVVFCAKA